MTARRAVAATLLAGLVLAGCGSGSPTAEPIGEQAPGSSVVDDVPAPIETQPDEPQPTTLAEPADPTETEPDTESGSEAPIESEPETDTTAAPTASTTMPSPQEAEPAIVHECSTDGAPTELEVADGPLPELAVVEPATAIDSPLPALAVRRINCGGGWVQLRNELAADQPLLVWFWAPH